MESIVLKIIIEISFLAQGGLYELISIVEIFCRLFKYHQVIAYKHSHHVCIVEYEINIFHDKIFSESI